MIRYWKALSSPITTFSPWRTRERVTLPCVPSSKDSLLMQTIPTRWHRRSAKDLPTRIPIWTPNAIAEHVNEWSNRSKAFRTVFPITCQAVCCNSERKLSTGCKVDCNTSRRNYRIFWVRKNYQVLQRRNPEQKGKACNLSLYKSKISASKASLDPHENNNFEINLMQFQVQTSSSSRNATDQINDNKNFRQNETVSK